MEGIETLRLLEGLLFYRNQQVRKARGKNVLSFRYGSSLKWSVERHCVYQGDNLAKDNVRPSHESLQEMLLVSRYEDLYWIIDKHALLKGLETVHTWILIVNMKAALYRVECTPCDDNICHL